METEVQINKLKEEYNNITDKLETKKKELNIAKKQYEVVSSKLQEVQDEVGRLNAEIYNLKTNIQNTKEKYIEEKKNKLIINMIKIQTILSISLAVAPAIYFGNFFSNLLNHIFIIVVYLGVGTFLVSGIYQLYINKYITKLENKYKVSSEYLEKKKELDNKIKFRDQKIKEWSDSKELKEYYAASTTVIKIKHSIIKLERKIEDFKIRAFDKIFLNVLNNEHHDTLITQEQIQYHDESEEKAIPLVKVKKT